MGRRKTREHAFKLVYQIQINNDDINEQMEQYFMDNEVEENARQYIVNAVNYINQNHQEIDSVISQYLAKNWRIERIPKVELAIMRLAYYEIMNLDDVPKSVAINEAVELAKAYGSDDAGKYINAVLANVQDKDL
ncbi:MAG: transcription antitermination factor NusB [Clostridia bacterium]|jgi:N utilization substance protein B|nr:transcription antitermination factor NusB [Clostridia bacterium]MDD3970788.1 transcription antitermination factor NusB [Clostridia bacterium]MDD4543164.1 transcription antitermination factor NusB [Clostridia bacterium]NLF37632.1 transcription antitermination factor NusB [Clostridiaceae bacterium]HXK71582.1 transcription antitermination factor NusB [Clostridia bacterium]